MDIRGRDFALLGALGLALVVTALALASTWGGHYWMFDAAVGIAVGLVVFVRLSLLVRVVVAYTVAGVAVAVAAALGLPAEPGPGAALALAVLTGAAVRRSPVPTAVAVAVVGIGLVVATAVADRTHGTVGGVTVVNGVACGAALGVGLLLRDRDARRRTTADRIRREERLDLARELHDVVAHHITGIVVQAQAGRLLARRGSPTVGDSLAGIETAGTEALAAMRRVVGLLRSDDDGAPLTPGPEDLGDLVRRFGVGRGTDVELVLPAERDWPPEVTTTVHRVVREALTNVARHAPQARAVTVRVATGAGAVTVDVVDDAPTVTHHPTRGGYGLVGMRERVESLGGTLSAGPGDVGWAVRARLPLRGRA